MQNPVDAGIATDNATLRAIDQRNAVPERPPLPDAALIGERLAVHGDDPGRDFRTRLAAELDGVCRQVGIIRKNPTLNVAQVELASGDAVRARVDRLLAECDDHIAAIDAAERAVAQGIDAALSPPRPEWHALGAEYRAVMRAMSDDERHAFVKRLESTGDMPALRYAVASVPAELSGFSFGIHGQMRDTVLALKDPALLTRPAELKRQRAALATAMDGIRRTAAELVNFETVDAIKALSGDGAQ